MNSKAVEYDDLVYADSHVFFYDGKPFSGVAEERFEDGSTRCVFPFTNGKEHGEVKTFFASGKPMKSTPYTNGAVHGVEREWFENGSLKIEREVEFGILVRSRTFDESGALVDEYVRPEDDSMMEAIKRKREQSI